MNRDICSVPGCKRPSALSYYRKSLCDPCWNKLSELPVDEMKDFLGIRRSKKKVIVAQPQPCESSESSEKEGVEP